MSTADDIANATRGMSAEIALKFHAMPRDAQAAYVDWWNDREHRSKRASHRDAVDPFAAAWHMRGQAKPAAPPQRSSRPRSRKAA